jgi:hypothetical protein
VNKWNRVHDIVRRSLIGILILFASIIALAIASREPLPDVVRMAGGAILLLGLISVPTLSILEVYARRRMDRVPRGKSEAACAFCKRTSRELAAIIAGPEEYICVGCVREAESLLPPAGDGRQEPTVRCSFCRISRPVSQCAHGVRPER